MPPLLQWFVLSDVGCVREANEDSVQAYPFAEDLRRNPGLVPPGGRLCVVADGMGGHRGGREASSIAVRRIGQLYYSQPGANPADTLEAVIHQVGREILKLGQSEPEFERMGTTVVLAVASGSSAYIANVGDSRAYLIRNGQIYRLTIDDRWVEVQLREGLLNDEQARNHTYRNLLTQYLGSAEPLNVHQAELTLQSGDLLLLCSDGLHDLVSEQEMSRILMQSAPEQAPRRLVNLALKRGAPDNVTVAVGYYGPLRSRRTLLPFWRLLLVGALLLLVGLFATLALSAGFVSNAPTATSLPAATFSLPTPALPPTSPTISRPTSTTLPPTSTPTPTPTPTPTTTPTSALDIQLVGSPNELTPEQQIIYEDCMRLSANDSHPRIILARTTTTQPLPAINFDFGDGYPQGLEAGKLVRETALDTDKCVKINNPTGHVVVKLADGSVLAETRFDFTANPNGIWLIVYQSH